MFSVPQWALSVLALTQLAAASADSYEFVKNATDQKGDDLTPSEIERFGELSYNTLIKVKEMFPSRCTGGKCRTKKHLTQEECEAVKCTGWIKSATTCGWEGPGKDIGGCCSENRRVAKSLQHRNTGHTAQSDCEKANEGLDEPKCTWTPSCPKCFNHVEPRWTDYVKWRKVIHEIYCRETNRNLWFKRFFGNPGFLV